METYKLTIHCTKEHLEKAKWCGTGSGNVRVGSGCWIAIAVQDIFPNCYVNSEYILEKLSPPPTYKDVKWKIPLPISAQDTIRKFDRTSGNVEERMKLEPFSFTVDIPQETLDIIMQCNGFKSMKSFSEVIFRTPHLSLEPVVQMS